MRLDARTSPNRARAVAWLSASMMAVAAVVVIAYSKPDARATESVNAAASPTTQAAATDPDELFETARTVFDDYLAGFAGVEQNLELPECPLRSIELLILSVASIGRDDVTAEVTARVQVMDASGSVDPSPSADNVVPIGVVCDTEDTDEVRPTVSSGGVYGVGVAAFDYALVPDVDLSAIPAQFPEVVDPSPDTFGFTGYRGCLGAAGDEGSTDTTQCYSWWERDRFVVGLYVTVGSESADETLEVVSAAARSLLADVLERVSGGMPQPAEVTAP